MTTPLPEPGHPPYAAPSSAAPSSAGPSFSGPSSAGPSFSGPPSAAPPWPQVAPPGWYPGPAGPWQWWDGQGWGPTAPPGSDASATVALFAHLGTLVGGFVVPLVLLLTEGRRNRFVKHHATEALNWSITTAMVSVVLFVAYLVAFVVGFAATTADGDPRHVGVFVTLIVVVVVVAVALSITSFVFVVLGAVHAGKRRYWRYPFAARLVKGAASKAQVEALDRGGVH